MAPETLSPADATREAAADGQSWDATLTTRTGFQFDVRPATPADEAAIVEFFANVTQEDLRFRFLTALQKLDRSRIEMLTHVDHRRTEDFLAFEPGGSRIIASAMLAADESLKKGEVAISVRENFKKRGIGWTMLEHVVRFAKARGLETIESVESRANFAAIELEREMGFTARECPGDPTLVILQANL